LGHVQHRGIILTEMHKTHEQTLKDKDALIIRAGQLVDALNERLGILEAELSKRSGGEIGIVKAARHNSNANPGFDKSKLFSDPDIKKYVATRKSERKAERGDPER
jgi:hypothetical protein